MKHIIIVLTFCSLAVHAQNPRWSWARSAGGTNEETGESCATDIVGNVCVAGILSSDSVAFGSKK